MIPVLRLLSATFGTDSMQRNAIHLSRGGNNRDQITQACTPWCRTLVAGMFAGLCLTGAPAEAMLPSLCNIYKHWSLVSEAKQIRSDDEAAATSVYRIDLDLTGDGLAEILLSSPNAEPAPGTLTMHFYSPRSSDSGLIYLGHLTLDEFQIPDDGPGLVIVRRDPDSNQVTREQFELKPKGLRSLAPPEPAPGEAFERARRWRAEHQVTTWQAKLDAIRANTQDGEAMAWQALSGDLTRTGAELPLDMLVRRDTGGRKSAARPGCLLE